MQKLLERRPLKQQKQAAAIELNVSCSKLFRRQNALWRRLGGVPP